MDSATSRAAVDGDTQMGGVEKDTHKHLDEGYGTEGYPTPNSNQIDSQDTTSSSFNNASHSSSSFGLINVVSDVTKLLQTMTKLEELGIEKFDVDLPKIVVVGDQSHGKSSLLEAISDVKVLRKSGLCTRCPLHMSLQPADEWTCNVTILKTHDYMGQDSISDDGYGPWHRKSFPDLTPFKVATQKENLEEVLARAQVAILNPKFPPGSFSTCPKSQLPATPQVEFSPNIIRLEIKAPNLPNLSFYDLPGVIAVPERDEDQYLTGLIAALSKDYISMPNSIVLLACSMESDRATSYASKIVTESGATGRCIGVLTKPDRLAEGGSIKMWKDMLQGKTYALQHGYYVTMGSTQKELDAGISHEAARKKEKEFFQKTSPWGGEFSKFKSRFGTPALQSKLSELLRTEICRSLPRIAQQIQEKIEEVEAELEQLPEPPKENPMSTIYALISRFDATVGREMQGDYPDNSFKLRWRARVEDFSSSLRDSRPALILKAKEDVVSTRTDPPEPISLDSDDEQTTSPSNSRKRATMAPPVTPSKRQRVQSSATPQASGKRNGQSSSSQTNRNLHACGKFDSFVTADSARFTLDDVRQTLKDVSVSDLPNVVDPRAEENLIEISTRHWDKLFAKFLTETEILLRTHLRSTVDTFLYAWADTQLAVDVPAIIDNYLTQVVEDHKSHTSRALAAERLKPLTFNEEWLDFQTSKAAAFLRDKRDEHRAKLIIGAHGSDSSLDATAQLDKIKKTRASPDFPPDPYAREIEVMARVRGYYNVAAAQLLDQVAKGMQLDLFSGLKCGLRQEIENKLGINGADGQAKCARLLSEDPERAEKRECAKMRMEKLSEAKATVDSLFVR